MAEPEKESRLINSDQIDRAKEFLDEARGLLARKDVGGSVRELCNVAHQLRGIEEQKKGGMKLSPSDEKRANTIAEDSRVLIRALKGEILNDQKADSSARYSMELAYQNLKSARELLTFAGEDTSKIFARTLIKMFQEGLKRAPELAGDPVRQEALKRQMLMIGKDLGYDEKRINSEWRNAVGTQ